MKYLFFKFYTISKNILLSTPNWSTLTYMPCQGLFHERNKTNFFNVTFKLIINDF